VHSSPSPSNRTRSFALRLDGLTERPIVQRALRSGNILGGDSHIERVGLRTVVSVVRSSSSRRLFLLTISLAGRNFSAKGRFLAYCRSRLRLGRVRRWGLLRGGAAGATRPPRGGDKRHVDHAEPRARTTHRARRGLAQHRGLDDPTTSQHHLVSFLGSRMIESSCA